MLHIKKNNVIFFIALSITCFFTMQTRAADRELVIDSLFVDNNILYVNLHCEGLIDDKLLEGLQRGLTSMIEYRIQLWNKKSLISKIIFETNYRLKIYFDNWERKYAIISKEENRLTSSEETLRQKCAELKNLSLVDIHELDPDSKYFVSSKMTYEPISTENYEQLSKWLQGEMGKLDPSEQRELSDHNTNSRSRIFSIFVNLLGFGDKMLSAKSKYFTINEDSLIVLK